MRRGVEIFWECVWIRIEISYFEFYCSILIHGVPFSIEKNTEDDDSWQVRNKSTYACRQPIFKIEGAMILEA